MAAKSKARGARRAVHAYSREAVRVAVVGWFDDRSVRGHYDGTLEDPAYSSRLVALSSGAWVEERDYNRGSRGVVCYRLSRRDAALWLIKHGYDDVADELFAGEVEATKL